MINTKDNKGSNLSLWLLIFGIAFAFFHIMPAFLNYNIKNNIRAAELFDFFTPFFIIFVVFMVYSNIKRARDSQYIENLKDKTGKIILFLMSIAYIDGHGIHLSANSLSYLLKEMEGTDIYKLNYLYDEVISHAIWDGGVIGISLGLIILSLRLSFKSYSKGMRALTLLGSACYGFTYTVNGIEGQTVYLTLPAAIIIGVFIFAILLKTKIKLNQNPVLLFFFCGYLIAIILFIYWGIAHSGFPEFSELGWIE
ncbi:MAG: hypothetical protein ACE5WD_13595 [Candidatus Aminicenantia bacterium]